MLAVELGEHQRRQLGTVHPLERFVHVDESLVDELDRDPERGLGGALAHPGLQHPELAVLDGELDVAQVAVVPLEGRHVRHQLVEAGLVDLLEVVQRDGVADARDDVLALRVLEVVAVDALGAGRRVAGEGDAGAGVHATVAEDHGADVDGGPEVGGDALAAPVDRRPLGVPRVEDGAHGHAQLLAGVLREVTAGVLADGRLVGAGQLSQVLGGEVEVGRSAALGLEPVDLVLEDVLVQAQHRLPEHRQQAPVGVPREPLVAALADQALDRPVVQADVEDGVHHSGHRELRAGAHRHQQRVVRVAEAAPHRLLQAGEVPVDLLGQALRLVALCQVGPTGVRGDREPRRDGQPEPRHLGEVRPLAPQQVLLVLVALGEVVHVAPHEAIMTDP